MANTKKKIKTKTTEADVLHVALLIDESGSMSSMANGVIAGVNEFIADLKADPSRKTEVRVWLSMFDLHGGEPPVRVKFSDVPLEEVGPLGSSQYDPRGMTPLNDAVARTIRTVSSATERGDRAMIVILSDGLENSSETTADELRKLILEREADGWEFVYLGANQDTWATTDELGLAQRGKHFAWDASEGGVRAALKVSGERVNRLKNNPREYVEERDLLADRIEPGEHKARRISDEERRQGRR